MAKMQTARLLIRLQCFALDEVDPTTSKRLKLTALQVRAIETLLKKTLSDLSTISLEGGDDQSEPIMFQVIHYVPKKEG